MKILHVVPTYLPAVRYGGPIVSVHGLCKALAARRHDVHVYTTNVDGKGVSPVPLGEPVEVEGVKVWYFPTGLGRRLYRSPRMRAALERRLKTFDVAHFHSVFLWPTTAAARIARQTETPYLICPRGMLVSDLIRRKRRLTKSAWIEIFERANIACAASLHLTSEIEAREFDRLGLRAKRIDIVPNGIEVPSDPEPEFSSLRNPAVPRVLSFGRISWKKGLDRLISAMVYVPGAELVVAGNDDEGYRSQLERLAADMGVAERTTFIGSVPWAQKWQLIRSCDVFVMPSYSENFGIAALEAMACGRALVLTPGVGLATTVQETGAGAVVDGDPANLGGMIERLISDPTERRRMGEVGRRVARERFAWSAIAERFEGIYRECIR